MYGFQALVHVSTAYCNCDRTEIQEVIYSTPYDPQNIINLISWLPEDVLDKVNIFRIPNQRWPWIFCVLVDRISICKGKSF